MAPANGLETGPASKIVRVPGSSAAAVALFPDGRAYYSPDGFNLGGGGATTLAYSGTLQIVDIVAAGGGIDALLSDGAVYFSPDGQHLGGGGKTVAAYTGGLQILALTAVGGGGIDAVFANGLVYYSPDGLNLGGGGNSLRVYGGGQAVRQIVAIGPGPAVLTLFGGGTAMFSPDNRNLGGGGSTVVASPEPVTRLAKLGGGVLAQFASGAMYLSPDGLNLAGGGGTISVPSWKAAGDAPFAPRDSAHGARFLGRLWLSGGYSYPTYSDSCYLTCSFFDLWSSTDGLGESWHTSPSFATATVPNPRDQTPVVNDGVEDKPAPDDFYDSYSALVVWNGQLTAIGSTVWRSADGVKWQRNNLADGSGAPGPLPAPRTASENSRAAILAGSLYFLQLDQGEVYRSTDAGAAVWTDLGAMPGFTARCGARSFVLLGKIWVVGGGACDYSAVYNDVWSSPDGINWTQSASPAQWSGRLWPCVASDGDGIVWLVGGYAPTDWNSDGQGLTRRYSSNHADVWYTRTGTDWRQLKADAGSGLPDDGVLEPRHAPTCYVSGSGSSHNLVILAGTGGPDPDDSNAEPLNSIRVLPLPSAASLP